MKRISSILLVTLLALVVAACSNNQASSSAEPSESTAATPSATPDATESEGAEPSEDASGSGAALPSFDINGDPELAARFPDSVGGEALQVLSFRGDTMMAGGGVDPSFQEFLDSTGADLEDVSIAVGGTASAAGTLSVAAFRVLGVPQDQLEEEFITASEEAGDLTGVSQGSIGGKDVWTATDPSGEAGATAYIYVKDDTVYFLTGTEEQATEILAALP